MFHDNVELVMVVTIFFIIIEFVLKSWFVGKHGDCYSSFHLYDLINRVHFSEEDKSF